jgi:biopolymer transport protein TolR
MVEINVVPYIDVMLVLLVIFMITTPLLTQGVKIDLPQASAKPLSSKDKEPVIVSVDKFGRYFLNIDAAPDKPMAPEELATRVAAELVVDKQQGIERPVLIKGDKDVDYGKVVQAMVLLQQSGVANVGLMTDPSQQNQTG